MKKILVTGIILLIMGVNTFATETRINLGTFLKTTLEEYRKFTNNEMISELKYKINTAENGIYIDAGYKKNKSRDYIESEGLYNKNNKNKFDEELGLISINKATRYGTTFSLTNEYLFSGNDSRYYEENGYNSKNERSKYNNVTTLNVEQSIFRTLLRGLNQDKISLNQFNADKNKTMELETYIINKGLENYINYCNTVKTIKKMEELAGEISEYIITTEQIESKNKFRIGKIRVTLRELDATILKEKQNLNTIKFTLCKFINKSYSDNSIIFEESSKEEIMQEYSNIIEQMYAVKIKKEKLDNEWSKFMNEDKKIDNMPEVSIYGTGRGIRYHQDESSKTSFQTEEEKLETKKDNYKTPDYVIGLKIRMELFDGISNNQIKLQEARIKISEENYKKMEREYTELKSLAKSAEATAYALVELKEKKINETESIIEGEKGIIKELIVSTNIDEIRQLNSEISELNSCIYGLIILYTNLNDETEGYYRTIFSDNYRYY